MPTAIARNPNLEFESPVPARTLLRLERPDLEPYYAEPLDPWSLQTADGTSYYNDSLRKIRELVEPYRSPVEGSKDRKEYPEWLLDAVETSLTMLFTKRCNQNDLAYQQHLQLAADGWLTDQESELIHKARIGAATPVELLQLREMGLGVDAAPYAKWGHAFNNKAPSILATVMDKAIVEFSESVGKEPVWLEGQEAKLRYQVNRTNDSEEANGIFVVRKRNVALCGLSTLVVERRSMLLRFDTELPEGLQDITDLRESRSPVVSADELYARPVRSTRAAKRARRKFLTHTVQPRLTSLNSSQFVPLSGDAMAKKIADSSPYFERAIEEEHPSIVQLATSYYGRSVESAQSPSESTDYHIARLGGLMLTR